MNVEQLQSFRRDGYLVVHDFVSPEELALLRAETRGLHEALANQDQSVPMRCCSVSSTPWSVVSPMFR